MQSHFDIVVNGVSQRIDGWPVDATLLEYLRHRGLTGAKDGGCSNSACRGTCSVCLVDWDGYGHPSYRVVSSCRLLLPMLAGREVITVEGLESGGALHPVQKAVAASVGSSCGYCVPGLVMALFEGYYRRDIESLSDLHELLSGVVCRCSGYRGMRDAAVQALRAARSRRSQSKQPRTVERVRPGSVEEMLPLKGDAYDAALMRASPDVAPLAYLDASGRRFYRPRSITELQRLGKEHSDSDIVGGGISIGTSGVASCLISTEGIVEMKGVLDLGDCWEVGASVTLSNLDEALGESVSLLRRMMGRLGSRQVRNRGTVGGSLCSGEALEDLGPVLMALRATVVLSDLESQREVPVENLLHADASAGLCGGEIIRSVKIPRQSGKGRILGSYKVATRRTGARSIVSAAFAVDLDDVRSVVGARIAFGGIANMPVRCEAAEEALVGKPWNGASVKIVSKVLRESLEPGSRRLASADYLRTVAAALLQKFFLEHPAMGTVRSMDAASERFLAQTIFTDPKPETTPAVAPVPAAAAERPEMPMPTAVSPQAATPEAPEIPQGDRVAESAPLPAEESDADVVPPEVAEPAPVEVPPAEGEPPAPPVAQESVPEPEPAHVMGTEEPAEEASDSGEEEANAPPPEEAPSQGLPPTDSPDEEESRPRTVLPKPRKKGTSPPSFPVPPQHPPSPPPRR